ncbi:YcxB family protein [Erythrobacter colymbi]|uniref:YcxB family protein n=1 Tax=Erythrobacter colymbi TaxID=1161202 RepID=UPI000A366282|nr:YcxB family protein [Erythrobacter colymbi]
MGEVEFRIGEAHFLAFGLLTSRKSFIICTSIIGAYLAFVLAVIYLAGGTETLWCIAGFAAFLITMMCLQRFSSLPRLLRGAYCEDAYLKEPNRISYDGEGFTSAFASGQSRRRWVDMVKWDEDASVFVVFQNRMLGYLFPKDQVPEAVIAELRGHLIASGLPHRGKPRK